MKKIKQEPKKIVKHFIVVGIFVILAGCSPEVQNILILPRENKIPENSIKIIPEKDFYPPLLHSDEWAQPIPVPGKINSAGAEDSPFVTPDGKTIYFTFVPDVNVPPDNQLIDGVTGLYVSSLEDNEWTNPERILLNDDLSLDGCETIQGNVMWFCSVRSGNYREVDLYTAEFVNGEWINWQNAGETINQNLAVGEMHITPNGGEIYFDGIREGGKGGHDIWVTRKVNNEWQIPENIESVNTADNEIRPFLSQDGNELWFSRWYLGSPAIFRSNKVNGLWQEAELIISQFAAEPSLDQEGNIIFAHHYFEEGTMIEADIYVARKNHD
ncbi:MAG: hypothetical protein MUO54_16990 [Anaerolineales bacterium]|nr:hypothetical protein [Anaerolineales bacterium]